MEEEEEEEDVEGSVEEAEEGEAEEGEVEGEEATIQVQLRWEDRQVGVSRLSWVRVMRVPSQLYVWRETSYTVRVRIRASRCGHGRDETHKHDDRSYARSSTRLNPRR